MPEELTAGTYLVNLDHNTKYPRSCGCPKWDPRRACQLPPFQPYPFKEMLAHDTNLNFQS